MLTTLLLLIAVTAHAKLGETQEQLIKRFGKPTAETTHNDGHFVYWEHANFAEAMLDSTGHSVIEWYNMHSAFSSRDADEIVQTVLGRDTSRRWITTDKGKTWRTADGKYEVSVFTSAEDGVDEGYTWGIRVGHARAVALLMEHVHARARAARRLTTNETVAPPPILTPRRSPNDCAIIAAEAYARLKPITYWCQIMQIRVDTAKEKNAGHAMVFYKYQENGNVFVYDERGAVDLHTTSERPEDLAKAKVIWSITAQGMQAMPTRIEVKPMTYDEASAAHYADLPTANPNLRPVTKADIGTAPAATRNNSATAGIVIFALVFILAIALWALNHREQPATISPTPVQATPPPVPSGPFAAMSQPKTVRLITALVKSGYFWMGVIPIPLLIAIIIIACDRKPYSFKWYDFWAGVAVRVAGLISILILVGIVGAITGQH